MGGWFRIGLVANQQTAWVHALLCGPDLPTVAVVDCEVPLPADPWALRTDAFELGHAASAPLQTYRVDLRGRGQAYADPAALLRGEPGTPVDMTMDLVWATDGTPYQVPADDALRDPVHRLGHRHRRRHQLPSRSVPGQRDHSWGVRDWWSMDWMWSALHLDDGTHLHGVNIRIPGIPAVSIGYVQDRDGNVTELETVSSREAFGDNGLPLSATLSLDPGEITADVEVRGHAPVA